MSSGNQGDPQWIVSNREDGTNVGAWHWVEHDAFPVYQSSAISCLCGKKYERDGLCVVVDSSEDGGVKCSGEATANNRRGKTIYLYELETTIKVSVTGDSLPKSDRTDGKHTATIKFPYIGEDTESDEWEFKVTCTTSGASSDSKNTVELALRPFATKEIRAGLDEAVKMMREKFLHCGHMQPSSETVNGKAAEVAAAVKEGKKASEPKEKREKEDSGDKAKITVKETFSAPPMVVYEAILDPGRMSAVTGGASIEPKEGGKFTLFHGAVEGTITKLEPGKLIEQDWRFSSWNSGVMSKVSINLKEKNGETLMELVQTGIPKEDKERTEGGWKDNIFARMRVMFGFGGMPAGI